MQWAKQGWWLIVQGLFIVVVVGVVVGGRGGIGRRDLMAERAVMW